MQTLYHQCGPSNNLRNNSNIPFMFFLYLFFCEFDANIPPQCRVVHINVITQVSQMSAEFSLFIIDISRYSSFDWITNSAINDSYLRNQYIVFHTTVNTRRDRCDERAAIFINSKLRKTNKLVRSTPLIWRQNVQMKGNRCHIKSPLNFSFSDKKPLAYNSVNFTAISSVDRL